MTESRPGEQNGAVTDETRRGLKWVFGEDTGLSSRTIAGVMLNVPTEHIHRPSFPLDGDDLGRCLRLLDKMPEWKARLDEVAVCFPAWQPLVNHWRELAALYAAELRENIEAGVAWHEVRMPRNVRAHQGADRLTPAAAAETRPRKAGAPGSSRETKRQSRRPSTVTAAEFVQR